MHHTMRALEHNQLDKVICQIAYEPWFSLDKEVGDFQRSISDRYPVSGMRSESDGVQLVDLPPVNNYSFSSADGRWTVNVTKTFVALSSSDYSTWEDFKERLDEIRKCHAAAFGIDRYTRVGLRYINAIRRSSLSADYAALPWSELISPFLLGTTPDHLSDVVSHSSVTEMVVDDDTIRLSSGLIVFHDTQEKGFLIDCDVFREGAIMPEHTDALLDSFNERCWEVFRDSVTDDLIEGMRRDGGAGTVRILHAAAEPLLDVRHRFRCAEDTAHHLQCAGVRCGQKEDDARSR